MLQAEKLKTYEPTKFRPGYASVKRNGVHSIFDPFVGPYTRTPGPIRGVGHIIHALKSIKVPVVGELLIPGLDFEESSGRIRDHNETPEAHLYIFNIIADKAFRDRWLYFKNAYEIHLKDCPFIHLEPMAFIQHEETFDTFFKLQTEFFKEEGVCWISPHHIYQPGKRTWNWMKRVPYKSLEAKVIDILPGTKGKKYEHSMGRMLCELYENEKHEKLEKPIQFKVGIFKGKTDAWRQKIMDNKEDYIGRWITTEFKNYTKYGVPSQARYKSWR